MTRDARGAKCDKKDLLYEHEWR